MVNANSYGGGDTISKSDSEVGFAQTRLDDSPTSVTGATIDVSDYRKFTLFLDIDSTLAPTDVLFTLQCSNDSGTTWYDYKNDFWGELRYEDTEVASGVTHCFTGECIAPHIRINAVGTGTDAANYFDVKADFTFMN